jgi:hypothetical protein
LTPATTSPLRVIAGIVVDRFKRRELRRIMTMRGASGRVAVSHRQAYSNSLFREAFSLLSELDFPVIRQQGN